MLKSFLHAAYILCWGMSVLSFSVDQIDQATYFGVWGTVNYLLWKDTK